MYGVSKNNYWNKRIRTLHTQKDIRNVKGDTTV